MIGFALAGPTAGPAVAQGVPTFDLRLFAERQAILEQTDRDLALQQDRLSREEELAEIERQQLASLEGLMSVVAKSEATSVSLKTDAQPLTAQGPSLETGRSCTKESNGLCRKGC